LQKLQERYSDRRNKDILSMVKFLSAPMGYLPGDGFHEMTDLRTVVKATCERLFPEVQDPEGQDPEEGPSGRNLPVEELTYKQKINREFDALLDQMGAAAAPTSAASHIEDEMALASKTGELTTKLSKLYKSVRSIPASSIESERAFSVASRFVTKIRSRLGDEKLDNFAFAKSKLKNDKLVKYFYIFSYLSMQGCGFGV
jgi:hypothetical protein